MAFRTAVCRSSYVCDGHKTTEGQSLRLRVILHLNIAKSRNDVHSTGCALQTAVLEA